MLHKDPMLIHKDPMWWKSCFYVVYMSMCCL